MGKGIKFNNDVYLFLLQGLAYMIYKSNPIPYLNFMVYRMVD
ncbi:hypothetical protein FM120_17585 [Sphingobacterium faecium PCAi_F2.5]|nr:hypothetical protein FM120_17585 [Sphingobacterium faecium PCAi_F2.5]